MDIFLEYLGLTIDVSIFNQILGVMTICFGILLIYSAKDIGTYSIIPKINCLLRFLVQPFAIYNMIMVPAMLPILIGAAIYDVVWAIFVLILLNQCGYLSKFKLAPHSM